MPPQNEGSQDEPLTPVQVYEQKKALANQRMALSQHVEDALQVLEWRKRETNPSLTDPILAPTITDPIAPINEAITNLRNNWNALKHLDNTRTNTPFTQAALRHEHSQYREYAKSEPQIQDNVLLELELASSLLNQFGQDPIRKMNLAQGLEGFRQIADQFNAAHHREQHIRELPNETQNRIIQQYWKDQNIRYLSPDMSPKFHALYFAQTHGDLSYFRERDVSQWYQLKYGSTLSGQPTRDLRTEFAKDRGLTGEALDRAQHLRTDAEITEDKRIAQYWRSQNPPRQYANRHLHAPLYAIYYAREHKDWTKFRETDLRHWHLERFGKALPTHAPTQSIRDRFNEERTGRSTTDQSSGARAGQPDSSHGIPESQAQPPQQQYSSGPQNPAAPWLNQQQYSAYNNPHQPSHQDPSRPSPPPGNISHNSSSAGKERRKR
ncbi:hypothetical protein ACQEU8_04095 [Streptomyces sp. CA-250714]|uniref:hypothetical protein n=1 Tax=Streptomyces sp. CA-250714 TaxID=3240060 RepID=UPI003D8CF394